MGKFIGNENIITNIIYRMQAYDSIMCGYFCIILSSKFVRLYKFIFSYNIFNDENLL